MNGNGTAYPPLEGLTATLSNFRSWWPDFYDLKVIFEKMMEQLDGEKVVTRVLSRTSWSSDVEDVDRPPGERKLLKKKNPALLGSLRLPSLHVRCPRHLWREQSWFISAGQCGNSVQLDWWNLSRWFFSWLQFYYQTRSECRRERF